MSSKWVPNVFQNEFQMSSCSHEQNETKHGMLQYLANATRLDMATALNILAQCLRTPQQKHVIALKRVLRYANGTREVGLTYHRANEYPQFSCCDSNYEAEQRAQPRTGALTIRAGAAIQDRHQKRSKANQLRHTKCKQNLAQHRCTRLTDWQSQKSSPLETNWTLEEKSASFWE
jgi:hypothetical protein